MGSAGEGPLSVTLTVPWADSTVHYSVRKYVESVEVIGGAIQVHDLVIARWTDWHVDVRLFEVVDLPPVVLLRSRPHAKIAGICDKVLVVPQRDLVRVTIAPARA